MLSLCAMYWYRRSLWGVMFTYIAASPFIFQEHFNMSPLAYSLCFGANAIAIMLGSLTVSLFHDATGALRVGSIGFGIMSLFVAAALFFSTSVWPVEVSLFVFMLFLGVICPVLQHLPLIWKKELRKRLCIAWIFDVPVRWSASPLDRIGKYALYNRNYHRCLLHRYMVLQSYCNLAYRFKGNQTIKEIHK